MVDAILHGAMDIEDLATQGRRRAVCPYYAARDAAASADVILVPYSCLVHRYVSFLHLTRSIRAPSVPPSKASPGKMPVVQQAYRHVCAAKPLLTEIESCAARECQIVMACSQSLHDSVHFQGRAKRYAAFIRRNQIAPFSSVTAFTPAR